MNNSSRLPYEACLIPNLSAETQHQIRDFSNYFVKPVGMLLAIMSIVSNSLVCVTVARNKSLQQPSLLMLCSLALTDLIYSPHSLYRDIKALVHEHMCPSSTSAEHFVSSLCILSTLGNLAVISRDRYQAIRKPWWYRYHVTKARAIKTLSVAWLISIAIVLLGVVRKEFQIEFMPPSYIISFVFYIVCFFVITFCYFGIFWKKNQPGETVQMVASLQREKRLANTVLIILLILFVTFMPALVAPLALHIAGSRNIRAFRPFYTLLLQLNAFLNPLLNFGRSRDMRRGLRELFKCSVSAVLPNNLNQNESVSVSVNIPLERVSPSVE